MCDRSLACSIGSSTTPISRLALALLLDIVAVSVPAVTTLPWGSFNDLMANGIAHV